MAVASQRREQGRGRLVEHQVVVGRRVQLGQIRRDVAADRLGHEQVGLVEHTFIKGSHASPDGYVSGAGLIEIKAPMPAAHLNTLLTKTISEAHVVQMQWQMSCSGRNWCDYISFSSDFPPAMQLWIKRVERDPRFIGELESEITQFIRELEAKIAKLSREYAVAA